MPACLVSTGCHILHSSSGFFGILMRVMILLLTRSTLSTSLPSSTTSSPWSQVPPSTPTACPSWRPWSGLSTRRAKRFATPLWSTPPLPCCVPHTRRPANPSSARACTMRPALAGPLLITVPILCPEDHRCWDVSQKVCSWTLGCGVSQLPNEMQVFKDSVDSGQACANNNTSQL